MAVLGTALTVRGRVRGIGPPSWCVPPEEPGGTEGWTLGYMRAKSTYEESPDSLNISHLWQSAFGQKPNCE